MYTHYFGLKQSPFSIAPDPRYLFMSERHREALAHLLYGIGSGGGFVLLTGEIGAGKTTVCRCFIEQIPANCRLAYIFNPKLTVEELLLSICDEFRIELAPAGPGAVSVKSYVDAINRYLLASHAEGKNNVLIIDEAQNLSADVLEQLRLLTNLETSERKLLQIILIGQPELRTMLARPELEQLAQRVIARYHLGSLTEAETGSYVLHRLAVAGATGGAPFPPALMGPIYRRTGGVPRRINLLCDRALLGAYVENSREVTRKILRTATEEVFAVTALPPGSKAGRPPLAGPEGKPRWPLALAGVVAGALLTGAAAWQLMPARAPLQALAKTPLRTAVPAPVPGPAAAPVPVPVPVPVAARVAKAAPAAPVALAAPLVAAAPLAHAGEQDALRELSSLWAVVLPEGDVCDTGMRRNLHCYQGKGGLYELRLLDRPAVLTLREGAKVSYALMTGMDDNRITLRMNGKTQTLDAGALAAIFDGSYTTLWSMPRWFRDHIGRGESGVDVDWIAVCLAHIDGVRPPAKNRPLDAAMQDRLRKFQAQQHLKADGMAGPRTYMRLNQMVGISEPRLLAASAKGTP